MAEVLTLFSSKDADAVLRLGGIGWFRLSLPRATACACVVVYHNARDSARPGDASRHRLPLLVGTIAGAHVDPVDGRVALCLSRIASAKGPAQPNPGRSPVGYCAAALLDQLRLGPWRAVAPVSLEQALALRRAEGIGRA